MLLRAPFAAATTVTLLLLARATFAQAPSPGDAPPADEVQPVDAPVEAAAPEVAPPVAAPTRAPTSAPLPTSAMPPPPPPVASSMWRHEWPTFSVFEGAGTIVAGVGTLVLFLVKTPKDPRWEGGILFDKAVRSGLRLNSESARKKVASLGDLPYRTAPVIPLIIDPLIASWLVRGDTKAAVNLEAVGLEAFSYAGLGSFISTRIAGRERPDSTECRRQHPNGACEPDTESFYSGHTTIVAASAGVVCANHRVMPLWGNKAADIGACALATTGAVASGVSRMAADRHYASDVIVGFGLGFGIGYAVPTLLHYSHDKDTDIKLSIAPGSPCTGACLKIAGSF